MKRPAGRDERPQNVARRHSPGRELSDLWWLGLVAGIVMVVMGFWLSGQFLFEKAEILLIFARDLGPDAGDSEHHQCVPGQEILPHRPHPQRSCQIDFEEIRISWIGGRSVASEDCSCWLGTDTAFHAAQ